MGGFDGRGAPNAILVLLDRQAICDADTGQPVLAEPYVTGRIALRTG